MKERCPGYLKNIPSPRNSVFRHLTAENSHSEPGEKDRDRPDTKSSHQLEIELPRARAKLDRAPISAEAIRDWINCGYEPPFAMNPLFFPPRFRSRIRGKKETDVEHDRDRGTSRRGNLVRSPVSSARRIVPRVGLHVPATGSDPDCGSFRGISDVGRRDATRLSG